MPRDTREGARRVILGLGSNHNPEKAIPAALDLLSYEFYLLVKSSRYVGPPEGTLPTAQGGPHGKSQPSPRLEPAGAAPIPTVIYSNMSVLIRTADSYGEIKAKLSALEDELGRDRTTPELVPIDVDILFIEGEIVRSPSKAIVVPHPDLTTKRHAAIPSSEVAPSLLHPLTGQALSEIAASLA